MPDVNWNKNVWDAEYDWKEMGEEWSEAWGSSRTQWFSTILPRIHPFLPCDSILEIAPGFGRWTKFLLQYAPTYCGIDMADACTVKCKEIFAGRPNTDFFTNDGFSLAAAKTQQYDFVFSFDSMVHAEFAVMDAYIKQILEDVLKKNGVAFIHHSNMKDSLERGAMVPGADKHCRDTSVCHQNIAELVQKYGGKILMQEIVTWGFSRLSDCFTLFCRNEAEITPGKQTLIENIYFDTEIMHAWNVLNKYDMKVPAAPRAAATASEAPSEQPPCLWKRLFG